MNTHFLIETPEG